MSDNPPAFHPDMSLRDWIAWQVFAGDIDHLQQAADYKRGANSVSARAFIAADAFLDERAKGQWS